MYDATYCTSMATNKNLGAEIGAGLVAAGAAAALGYYFYGSKKAKQHRKSAVKWAHDMKRDVMKEVKHIEKAGPGGVAEVVDRVSRAYRDLTGVGESELKQAVAELKDNWELVQKEAKGKARTAKKVVKKVASKAKKAVRKSKK